MVKKATSFVRDPTSRGSGLHEQVVCFPQKATFTDLSLLATDVTAPVPRRQHTETEEPIAFPPLALRAILRLEMSREISSSGIRWPRRREEGVEFLFLNPVLEAARQKARQKQRGNLTRERTRPVADGGEGRRAASESIRVLEREEQHKERWSALRTCRPSPERTSK